MSSVDAVLKSVGLSCTILRAAGNVATSFYMSPKGSWRAATPYARDVMFPTDSGIVGGDVVQQGSDYYLVVSLYKDTRAGEFFYYKARMYKCNAVMTVRAFNATTQVFEDAQVGVHGLLVDIAGAVPDDRSIVVPTYTGKDRAYRLYIPASSGVNKNSMLVDAASVQWQVSGDIDTYFADGVIDVPVKAE